MPESIDEFPVTDDRLDAPDLARIFHNGQVMERRGATWHVLGPETLTLRKVHGRSDIYIEGRAGQRSRYAVVLDGVEITEVYERRVLGRKRMRPCWRWCIENVDHRFHTYLSRADAVEAAVLAHYDAIEVP